MQPLHLFAWFVGGAALINAVPHLGRGAAGQAFPSPFAKPPGRGLSSPMVNVLWGFANLVLAYLLICRVGTFDLESVSDVVAVGAGILLLGLSNARHFGSLNGGRGPGAA